MKAGVPALPKANRDLALLVYNHVMRERERYAPKWSRMLLAHQYLQGYRIFKAVDGTGRIIWQYQFNQRTDTGPGRKLPFQLGEMLKQINDVSGTMAGMDLRPHIAQHGISLSGINEQAGARIIAEAAIRVDMLDRRQSIYSFLKSHHGSCGIIPHVIDDPREGLIADYEVIHPREAYPFPSPGWNISDQRGIVRSRLVPLSQLKRRFSGVTKDLSKMEVYRKTIGEPPQKEHHFHDDASDTSHTEDGTVKDDTEIYVALNELFIEGAGGLLEHYSASSKETVFTRRDADDLGRSYFPIGWGVFMETGDFHGAGMFDLVFHTIREFEKMVEDLVKNTIEQDRYPIAVLPSGAVHERSAWTNKGRGGLKYLSVEPQNGLLGEQPFRMNVIQPVNSGEAPERIANFLAGIVDRTSPIRDLLREKGRVDNASALRVLQEDDQKSLQNPVRSTTQAWSRVHKAALDELTKTMLVSRRPIPINRLTLDLVGAVIDFDDGTVDFTESNRLPDVGRLDVSVKETSLTSEAAQKQEAQELLGMHGDIQNFVSWAVQNGVEFAMDMSREKTAYESLVVDILMLYQDGQTPGMITPTPSTTLPDVQLQWLRNFMASNTMKSASAPVVDAFTQYKMLLERMLGVMLPQSVPDPYDDNFLNQLRQGIMSGYIPPTVRETLEGSAQQEPPVEGQAPAGAPQQQQPV